MSAIKVMRVISLTLILLLTLVGQGGAQGQQPTASSYPPVTDGHKAGGENSAQAATVSSAEALTLGAPGLSFRYVQTFGVTGEPYAADGTHLDYPNGLFIDTSDTLFVTEEKGYRVLAYNQAGVNTMILGHAGQPWGHADFLFTPKDIAKDGAGNIWIVFNFAALKQFDSTGATVIQSYPATNNWETGSTNDRFNDPRGIAFDAAGLMYISDGNNHRVQVYNVSGATPVYVRTIGVTGVPKSDNTGFNYPGTIAFDSLGRLYVVDANNYRIQRCIFGVDWICSTFFGMTGVQGSDLTHLGWAYGLTIKDDNIFIADSSNFRVLKCTTSAVCALFAGVSGVSGNDNTHFAWAADVAVDSSGNVFVSDYHNLRVQKFNSSGVYQSTIGVTGVPYLTDNNHFNTPWGIAAGPDGSFYVTENRGYRLVKFNASGAQQWSVGQPGVFGSDNAHFGSFWVGLEGSPAIDAIGHVYVGDTGNNRVQIFNADGSYNTTLGVSGTGNYEFNCPADVAISPVNGDIYVADYCNHRIQVFTSSQNYKATLGATGLSGSDNLHFNNPRGVALDSAGNLYVADSGNHRIQKCYLIEGAPGFACSTLAGETGVNADDFGHLAYPESVKVDASGLVYVADEWNCRIQVFNSSGAYLTTIAGSNGGKTGDLRNPTGLALDKTGNLYVADRDNHRIQKFASGVPGWQQANINGFGKLNNWAIHRMSVFNGYLYASTDNNSTGGEVWRTNDGHTWAQVNIGGFGNVSNTTILVGESFNGFLYAGTGNLSTGAEIWRCATCNGTDWTQVVSAGFGDVNNTTTERIVVLANTLYATTDNVITGVEVWKSSTGNLGSWTQANADGFGDARNSGLWGVAELNGYLYAGTSQWDAYNNGGTQTGSEVWRTNGTAWNQVNSDGFGDSNNIGVWLEAFNGNLYALSTNYDVGAEVWRCASCNGSDWLQVAGNGFGVSNNPSGSFMLAFNGSFYAATNNTVTGTQIWRTNNGTYWYQVNADGFGDSNNVDVWSGAIFKGRLFLGTRNDTGSASPANGGEIWQMLNQIYLPLVIR